MSEVELPTNQQEDIKNIANQRERSEVKEMPDENAVNGESRQNMLQIKPKEDAVESALPIGKSGEEGQQDKSKREGDSKEEMVGEQKVKRDEIENKQEPSMKVVQSLELEIVKEEDRELKSIQRSEVVEAQREDVTLPPTVFKGQIERPTEGIEKEIQLQGNEDVQHNYVQKEDVPVQRSQIKKQEQSNTVEKYEELQVKREQKGQLNTEEKIEELEVMQEQKVARGVEEPEGIDKVQSQQCKEVEKLSLQPHQSVQETVRKQINQDKIETTNKQAEMVDVVERQVKEESFIQKNDKAQRQQNNVKGVEETKQGEKPTEEVKEEPFVVQNREVVEVQRGEGSQDIKKQNEPSLPQLEEYKGKMQVESDSKQKKEEQSILKNVERVQGQGSAEIVAEKQQIKTEHIVYDQQLEKYIFQLFINYLDWMEEGEELFKPKNKDQEDVRGSEISCQQVQKIIFQALVKKWTQFGEEEGEGEVHSDKSEQQVLESKEACQQEKIEPQVDSAQMMVEEKDRTVVQSEQKLQEPQYNIEEKVVQLNQQEKNVESKAEVIEERGEDRSKGVGSQEQNMLDIKDEKGEGQIQCVQVIQQRQIQSGPSDAKDVKNIEAKQQVVPQHQTLDLPGSSQLPNPQQKQKIRLNSEYIESIPDDNKQKPVVQFVQYNQSESAEDIIHSAVEQHKTKSEPVQIVPETPAFQQQSNASSETPMGEPDLTENKTPKQSAKLQNQQQTIKYTPQKVENQSPKKQTGKIARKLVHDKKVHEIVQDLRKYDEKKGPLVVLTPQKKSINKKTDLSKLDSHVGIQSNVMSMTIGQITSKDEIFEAEQQFQELKSKLEQLEKKKEERMAEEQAEEQEVGVPVGTIVSFRSNKINFAGRIIKKVSQGDSRLWEQNRSNLVGQHQTINSGARSRAASTRGFQAGKHSFPDDDMSRTVNFRVRRPSKGNNPVGFFQNDSMERETPDKLQALDKQDECFQTSRRQDQIQKIEFTQQNTIATIEFPVQRELQFEPNFRQSVQKYFIQMGNEAPTKDFSQQELIDFAKHTFKQFGVNLQMEKSATLSVKKYKNCVSFVLDSQRTILWYYEGKFYYGGWKVNHQGEGEKTGWGFQYHPAKYAYSGNFRQNKRDGYGVIKFLNRQKDVVYEGNWCKGFKDGMGKQIESDGSEYIGIWKHGKRHGYGTLKISQTEHYAGQFLAGIKNKSGTEVFKNGDMYVGQYKNGKFHGKGNYTWANHSRYNGDFIEGARQGYGAWVANHLDSHSDRYEGHYKGDKKNGFGKYFWKDRTTYEGYFLNDLKHGEGIVSYGDGRTARLQWFQGAVVPRTKEKGQALSSAKRVTSNGSSQKLSRKERNPIKASTDSKVRTRVQRH